MQLWNRFLYEAQARHIHEPAIAYDHLLNIDKIMQTIATELWPLGYNLFHVQIVIRTPAFRSMFRKVEARSNLTIWITRDYS